MKRQRMVYIDIPAEIWDKFVAVCLANGEDPQMRYELEIRLFGQEYEDVVERPEGE